MMLHAFFRQIVLATFLVWGMCCSVVSYAAGYGANLVVNGNAESVGKANSRITSFSGWTNTGPAAILAYGGAFPSLTSPGPSDRGNNFFFGGSVAQSSIIQDIDISFATSDIDANKVAFDFSAYLGGYSSQTDAAKATVTFYSSSNQALGAAQLGPVTNTDRNNQTGLLSRSITGFVPVGARRARVEVDFTGAGGDNDGYADNISLVLAANSAAAMADCVFNWAESSYGDLFAPRSASLSYPPFYFRAYGGTKAYLALYTSNDANNLLNHLLYSGPLSSNAILDLGPISQFQTLARCSSQGSAVPDTARAKSALIVAKQGGTITTTGSDGTQYSLQIPTDALLLDTTITMTPIASMANLPATGGFRAGVLLEPEGARFMSPLQLTIVPVTSLPVSRQIGFSFQGTGADTHLFPINFGNGISFSIQHFSGYDVADGTSADKTAQAAVTPATEQSAYEQRAAQRLDQARQSGDAGQATQAQKDNNSDFGTNVVKQQLQRAAQSDSMDYIADVMTEYLSYHRQRAVLGIDDDRTLDELAASVNSRFRNMIKEAWCSDPTNEELNKMVLKYLRMLAVLGVPEENWTELKICGTSTRVVNFEGAGSWNREGGDGLDYSSAYRKIAYNFTWKTTRTVKFTDNSNGQQSSNYGTNHAADDLAKMTKSITGTYSNTYRYPGYQKICSGEVYDAAWEAGGMEITDYAITGAYPPTPEFTAKIPGFTQVKWRGSCTENGVTAEGSGYVSLPTPIRGLFDMPQSFRTSPVHVALPGASSTSVSADGYYTTTFNWNGTVDMTSGY